MRTCILAMIAALGALPAQATEMPKRVVNLDAPGVLDALERDNPGHYRSVVEILRVARVQPCETLPQILKARLDVFEVECRSYTLLTSLPPKRHLSFRLGETGYVINAVQYHLADGKMVPAR